MFPANHRDRWGEPIAASGWTFSLAAMFRLTTAFAVLLGWLMAVRERPDAAIGLLAVGTLGLTAVAVRRMRSSLLDRCTVGGLFLLGVPIVAGYIAGVFLLFLPPQGREFSSLDAISVVFGSCFGIFAFVPTATLFLAILRVWLHLAAEERERARGRR